MAQPGKIDEFTACKALRHVLSDASARSRKALSQAKPVAAAYLLGHGIPGVSADYPGLTNGNPNYETFIAEPSNDSHVRADIANFMRYSSPK